MFKQEAAATLKETLSAILMLILVLVPAVVYSGDSSQSKISIFVGEAAKISKIDDWVISIHTSNEDMGSIWEYKWDYECVFSSTGAYSVELTSSNGGSELELRSESGVPLKYELWAYVKKGASYSLEGPFTTTTLSIVDLTGSASHSCQGEAYGGHNLFFAPLVRQANFNAAPTGVYRDKIVITVRPE